MQYEPCLTRRELSDLTQNFISSLEARDASAALNCFNDGALFCVQTSFKMWAGKAELSGTIERFFLAYHSIICGDCVLSVDEQNGRIAASFKIMLSPVNDASTEREIVLFARIRLGKFQEVYGYMGGQSVFL